MGELSDVDENVVELTGADDTDKKKSTSLRVKLQRRTPVFGLRLIWLVAAAIATIIVIILSAVLLTVLPRRASPIPTTGKYPADAPFREVTRSNFPDPALFQNNGTWYVYATNSAAGIIQSRLHGEIKDLGASNVQIATFSDLLDWTLAGHLGDPLPRLGDWVSDEKIPAEADTSILVRKADVWAPDILQRQDGKFVLYYTATVKSTSMHCIGAAVSDSPTGPFEPQADPLVCPIDLGGAIDPGSFIDVDGSIYLAYKVDGNAKGNGGECLNGVPPLKDTPILLQRLGQDGITPLEAPFTILNRTADDGPLVEAPTVIRSEESVYFMFFSSGCTWTSSYNLKYATSRSLRGPWYRAPEPLLKTGSYGLLAPGSPSIWRDGKSWHIAFHARLFTEAGGIRAMYVSTLVVNGTNAWLEAPS